MIGVLLKCGLLFAVLLAPMECSRQRATGPAVEKKMENIETNNLPKLEVNFDADEKSLTVEYKIRNTTNSAIYLFNVIPSATAVDAVSDEPFYSCLRDDGTLVLAKMIPPLPRIKSVELRQIPYVTKVEAGKDFSEKVNVPLPLDEYSPYFAKLPDSKVEIRKTENAVFILQFIREKEGLKVEPANIPNAYKVWHKDLFGNVEALKTEKRPLEVAVNRRTDTFERF